MTSPPEDPPAQDVEDELRFYRVDTKGMSQARMREVHEFVARMGRRVPFLTRRTLRRAITSDSTITYVPYRGEAGTRVAVLHAVGIAVLVGTFVSVLGHLSLTGAAYVAGARFGAGLDAIFFALSVPFGKEQNAAAAASQMRKEYGDAAHEALMHVGACVGAVMGSWLGTTMALRRLVSGTAPFWVVAIGILVSFRVVDFEFHRQAGLVHLWMSLIGAFFAVMNQYAAVFAARLSASQQQARAGPRPARRQGEDEAASASTARRPRPPPPSRSCCSLVGSAAKWCCGFCFASVVVLIATLAALSSVGLLNVHVNEGRSGETFSGWTEGLADFASRQHYRTLGVEQEASMAEVKRAYHKQSLRWHPDKCTDDAAVCEHEFERVRVAYEALAERHQRQRQRASGRGRAGFHDEL